MAGSERSGPISGKQHSLVASRLASEIQKTINTGLASMKVMEQIDEVIKSNFERKIIGVLKKIDRLLNSNAKSKLGNRIGLLYVKIVSLQDLRKSTEEGYRLICSPKGRVKVSLIKELLRLDEEIAQFINILYELIPQKTAVKEESLSEAEEIVEDLFSLLNRRENLLRKLKQTKG